MSEHPASAKEADDIVIILLQQNFTEIELRTVLVGLKLSRITLIWCLITNRPPKFVFRAPAHAFEATVLEDIHKDVLSW